MLKKIFIIILIFILISTIVRATNEQRVIGEILEIKKIKDNMNTEIIKTKILEGSFKNKIINVNRERIEYSRQDFDMKIGDNILIELYLDKSGHLAGRFLNIWRIEYLKKLCIIFIIFIIIFGGIKGILSISSLIFSAIIIIKFMIPLILKGYNAIIISIFSASIIIIVSFILIAGFSKKSLVSILGTVGGTLVGGTLSYIYSKLTYITGLANEDIMFLVTNVGLKLNFNGLYMSSIIIGTIGVVMDVSMSITSSIFEIKKHSPNIRTKNLLHSGFQVGKDIMSTMVNTLILAYAGSSMPLLIINTLSNTSYIYSINTELMAMEIIRSLCGSIGLISTIPLTVFIACHTAQNNNIKTL